MNTANWDVFSSVPGLRLVVIYGSLARGEASWRLSDQGEKCLYNDADFVLVVEDRVEFGCWENSVRTYISRSLNVKEVDLVILDQSLPAQKKSTIWYRDLINAHSIVFGTRNTFNEIFLPDPGLAIANTDLISMFYTRSWAIAVSAGFGLGCESTERRTVRQYQVAKSIFATADFLCLASGSYKTYLKEKRQCLAGSASQASSTKFILDFFDWAVDVKHCVDGNPELQSRLSRSCIENLVSCYRESFVFMLSRRTPMPLFRSLLGIGSSGFKGIYTGIVRRKPKLVGRAVILSITSMVLLLGVNARILALLGDGLLSLYED